MIRTSRSARGRTRGLTLLEVLIGLGLLGVVIGNVYMVLGDGAKSIGARTQASQLDAHVRRTLDRIAMSLVGASRASLYSAQSAPFDSSVINYQTSLGVQSGAMVASDPQRIALTNDKGRQISWFENPGQSSERRVAWSNQVAEWLKGELGNGLDDNSNGLIDEKGLSFDVEGNSVIIRLTVKSPGTKGEALTQLATVTCRN